jgi:Na+-translocating ferredoxin:NAD+ oxidoreductase RnfD subunit
MVVSWPPFMRLGMDSQKYHLRKLASLLPLAAGAVYCFGADYPARLGMMAGSAILLRMALVRYRALRIEWSQVVYEAVLLSLAAPRILPWQLAWICPAAVMLLRWLLGGKESVVPLNIPAAVLAMLLVHFGGGASAVKPWPAPAWFGPAGDQFFLSGTLPAVISMLAALALLARLYKFRFLAGFALPALILSGLAWYNTDGSRMDPFLALNSLLVASVWLAADEASTPRAGWAQVLQGLMAAMVFSLFAAKGLLYQAMVWSAFIPSLASSWLDAVSVFRSGLPRIPSGPGIME